MFNGEGTIDFTFPSAFMDNVEFDQETYTFKITSKTSDDLNFESSIGLYMNL